jgi:hypothetical protein
VALIFIFKADTIANKLQPIETGELAIPLDKTTWIELAIIIISGLAILNSFPEIIYKGVQFVYFNEYDRIDRHRFWNEREKAYIFFAVFKFVVALVALLNARNFAQRLQRIGEKDEEHLN